MTQTYASQTDVRSIIDRASMDYEQMYRDTSGFGRTKPMNDGNGDRPTEDDSSGVRAND